MVLKQLSASLVYKAFSMLLVLFIPYLLTKTFTEYQYGLWSIYQSSVMWFLLMDLGLGNALVNKLPDKKKYSDRLSLLIFTNKLSIYISIILIILNFTLYLFISNYPLSFFIGLSIITICIPFNIIGKYWMYRGKAQNIEYYSLISNLFFSILISILFYTNKITLNIAVISFSFFLLAPKVYFFFKTKILKTSLYLSLNTFGKLQISEEKSFLVTSINFFLCQILFIAILTSIRYFFAWNDLFEYAGLFDLLFRPGTIAIMFFVLLLRPVWSQLAHHYVEMNKKKCIRLLYRTILVYISFIALTLILQELNFFSILFNIWTPNFHGINNATIVSSLLFTFLVILNNIISYIMNGLNLIKEQMYLNSIGLTICLLLFLFLGNQHNYNVYVFSFTLPFLPLIFAGILLISKKIRKL